MQKKGRPGVQRIGDLARKGGVGVETIRFYEREGLIEKPIKPMRGWREYGERQVLQLSYVRRGQQLGLTLGDVSTLQTSARDERSLFCSTVRLTISKRLAKIETEIRSLQRKRAGLKLWLAQCEARSSAGDCPLYAQLEPVVTKKERNRG